MRILHVINRCGKANGAAKLILDIVANHKQKGYIADVLALVEIEPSYKQDFEKIGCSYVFIYPQGHSMMDPRLLLKMKEIMREYDIIHAHLFPAFYWVALAKVIFNLNCKLVFTEHATENNRRRFWMRPIERYIYRQYDCIVAISDAVKNNLENHLCLDYNIITIENGVNIAAYKNVKSNLRQELGVSCDDKIIMQIAGFRPEKDQITVIEAMTLLPTNYYAIFVGGGSLLDAHIKIVQEKGLMNRCRFLNVRNDVPMLLEAADVVVVSSHFEGFGLVAVEGMSSHKPVIASNVAGLSEVVQDAGLLFEPMNANELAQKIQSLCEDIKLYDVIAEKCYNWALLYDISLTANKYEEKYKSLINTKIGR